MASTRLTRTPSSGDNQKYTVSCWVKRTGLGASTTVYSTGDTTANNNGRMLFIDADDKIEISYFNSGYTYEVTTNRVLRDTNAWFNIVVAFDTTQATASDRIKIWVNGEQESSFATSSYPSLNASFNFGSATHYIGDLGGRSIYSDFVLSHLHYIDGTTYAASAFGETDSTTGIWKPKTAPSVTYGSNGVFLKFENSAAFGTDSSGNGNTFTVNGTMTQTIDTPSNVFATKNLLDVNPSNTNTFANGNTTITTNGNGARSTLGASTGKYYAEVKYVNQTSFCGIMDLSTAISSTSAFIKLFGSNNGEIFVNGSSTDTNVGAGTAIADNSIIMFAMDLDNNRLYIGKNGLWWTSGSGFVSSSLDSYKSFTNTNSNYWGFVATTGSGSSTSSWNFGNGFYGTTAVSSAQNPDDGIGIFEYDVPAGYRALCTKSINAEEYS